MLTRRAFFGGACCLLHAGPALAEKRSRPRFICATSDEKWLEPGEIPMAQASLYPLERWTPNHNFTRDQRLITLNVGFMGGTREQKRTVQRFASEWIGGGLEKHIRFVFDTSLERSHIRVSFKKNGGNVPEVGARADHVPKSKPTMNLADLTRRAILHEFGHALGLRHEHHHPEAGIVWNRPAVLARYREHGWSDKKIEENVFRRFNKTHSCNGSAFDPDSVMLYPFDRELTLNGVASKLNEHISRGDRRCLIRTYSA
jgi:hypothetical protein